MVSIHIAAMARMPALLLSAAWILLASTAGSGAEALQAAVSGPDRNAIASCLRDSIGAPRACIGTIAVVCARQTAGDRRTAEIECSRRETAVWRERLDLASAALAQPLAAGPRSRFAAVQRSWEAYSTQQCAFLADLQPPARAPVLQAACELREVAARALEVERLVRRRTRETPRPEIQR